MGRGAHAAHAAYNGSGTQGISVTNKINKDEEIHSVFITENDTTKQILHGHNISEMTCSGKIESITSERYKIFTPGENDDMLGDIYLNFEMDSEISDFEFVDTSPGGQPIPLQNVTPEAISKSFSMGGEDYNFMNVDYSNNSLPVVNSTTKSDVSYINKILNVIYDNVNYEIVVGKGTSNMAVRELPGSSWSNHDISNFSEIIDIIMINVDNKDLLIVGGRPATATTPTPTEQPSGGLELIIPGTDALPDDDSGVLTVIPSSPYKVLEIQNSSGTISITPSDLVLTNNNLYKNFNIIVKLFYENDKLIMSGFKYHDNEVLRANVDYFHTDDANYQTTFIITGLSWNAATEILNGTSINGITFTPDRDTASKRLENYNYKDCLVSSSIKYDDTNYAYITGSKEKVLLALSPNQYNNNEIKRSYDNGLNWEDVNFYQTSDNYYPMSNLYNKNETLVHTQLNNFQFLVNDLNSYTIANLKTYIVNTYGYIKNDIKIINKRTKMEYDDIITLYDITQLDPVVGEAVDNDVYATEYDLSSYVDIRIKDSPIIKDYDHIWVNIRKNNNNFKKIWTIAQNIRMISKKPYGAITRIIVTDGGTGYASVPIVTIAPNDPGGTFANAAAVLTDGVVTSFNVSFGGSGYTFPPHVTIDPPPSGETATATAILTNGVLTSIDIISGGSGYTFPPAVTIDPPPTVDNAIVQNAVVTNGSVTTIILYSGGSGYTFPPAVTIDPPPSGETATATAVLTDGVVTSFDILSGGSGYTSEPVVTIDPRPASETATATAVITNGILTSIDIISGGSGYDGTELVTILAGGGPGGNGGARAIIDRYSISKDYLTFGEFKQNISGTLGLTTADYNLVVYYTLGGVPFIGINTDDDDKNVFDLGLLQTNKVTIESSSGSGYIPSGQIPKKLITFRGSPANAENKPVDERLNDKFKIYLVIGPNVTVNDLKIRLVNLYGGVIGDYLISDKTTKLESVASDNLYSDSKVVYGSTGAIIENTSYNNQSIVDTYSDDCNLEIRFKNTHPILSLSDPKIIYVSIPMILGNGTIKRRTVSLLAEDLSTGVYITLGQLKTKIRNLLDPLYTDLNNSTVYALSLVKSGTYDGAWISSDNNNFYGIDDQSNIPYFDDNLVINSEIVGIKGGDILYFYFSYSGDPYVVPTLDMTNNINISLRTDPLYSENIISRLGVMDDLKYYIPNINVLVNNDKGLWVAAGTPGDPDFSITGKDVNGNPIEEVLKRPNLCVFVSNNDGYNWHPVKFSVIQNNTLGISYKDADVEHYDDPKYMIEYVSGYVSNSRGDIRITFNIYDTSFQLDSVWSLVAGNNLGKLVTTCILDIDHYKICPDVISNYSLKAIKMSHIIDNIQPNCPLTYADSVRNGFDLYTFFNINPHVWSTVENSDITTELTVKTINSNIIYTYNEKIKITGDITEVIHVYTEGFLFSYIPFYKKLGSYLITVLKTRISASVNRIQLFRKTYIGGNTEIIKIDGETYSEQYFDSKTILETDSNKKAVLLIEKYSATEIYSYDDINLNFKKVVTLQYLCNNVNFLENVWIISGINKLLISYDTVHWREINTSITINKLFSKNNRYHDVILTYDAEKWALKPKGLTNNVDKYKGISLFHDISIRGGIKVNIDEELVADRTNYIIENYSYRVQPLVYTNHGTLYKPNDIIKISDRYIICGNNSGLGSGSNETLTLIESSVSGSQFSGIFEDDIIFFESSSIYTNPRSTTIVKDFINNFDMERFYTDTNVPGDNVYCSGSYTHSDGTSYGILAIRSIPFQSERSTGHATNRYYWKLIYAPSLSDVPINSYDNQTGYENDIRVPWQDTIFEKINDLVFADNRVVIVGKGKTEVNLSYSSVVYPDWFGRYISNNTQSQVKLNFQEIHTVCFYKGYWVVGGKPIYKTNDNGDLIKNNNCLAYTSNILGDWTYEDFPSQASDSSIYEVNNMEVIDINGNKSILTNISYIKKVNNVDNLVTAIIFIDIDYIGKLSFINGVQFNNPGITEIETTPRIWNGFILAGTGFDREKWLNRPFNLEIEGINRNIISTIHSPKTEDMYYVEYNSNLGFILISYKDPNIPIIDKSEFGEYPKFIKHIKLGTETLTNKTGGHCYKMAEVTNQNFITGLNSAKYVAVGKGLLSPISYSDDFQNWTYADAGNIFDIVFDVTHKHGLWIAIGEGNYNVGISKDGKSWTGVYSKWGTENLITTTYDSTLNSISFSPDTKITDVLPYIPELKGIFLRNLAILRLFSRIEYRVGTQIWQTLTFDDIKAMLDTEFGAGEYANLLKHCSIINKSGSTRLTTWIPGFTKTLNSKLETFTNVSERGSFPSGLLKDQKLSIKIYYNKLENIITDELQSSDMNNAVFDNFMNNTLIPTDRDPNYFIDSFIANNYGFQLGDIYKNVNGYFKLKYKTEIQKFRLFSKRFELDDIEIDEFNKGVKQMSKMTQSLYFDADNVGYLLLDLDSFNLYASHIIVSGWLTSGVHITDMNLELNGHTYQKVIEPGIIDYATKSLLGLNYNRYTFNGVDKEDGTGSLVIPLASSAYSGSSVPLDRYTSIRLRINFNALAGPRSYINVTCVGTTTVSYNNSTANIDIY